MPLTFNTKTYTADSFQKDQIGYNGPANTSSVKDILVLRRTAAKPTSVFSGVFRANFKLTRTHVLSGALTTNGDSITEISVSLPVGRSDADVDAISNDLGAYVAGADFKSALKNAKVSF